VKIDIEGRRQATACCYQHLYCISCALTSAAPSRAESDWCALSISATNTAAPAAAAAAASSRCGGHGICAWRRLQLDLTGQGGVHGASRLLLGLLWAGRGACTACVCAVPQLESDRLSAVKRFYMTQPSTHVTVNLACTLRCYSLLCDLSAGPSHCAV
jgi:hypothetical protein